MKHTQSENFSATTVENPNIILAKTLWEETLRMEGIPLDSNFFSIGGHSLLGMDICNKAAEMTGAKIALKDLMDNPTIRAFAEVLPQTRETKGDEVKGMAKDALEGPLSFNQFQAWYQQQMNLDTSLHHLPSVLTMKGSLERKKLNNAYRTLIQNHEALRTVFVEGPAQKVLPADQIQFEVEYEEGMNEDEAFADMKKIALQAFDLESPPLFRAKVYAINPNRSLLFNCFHHMIMDGYSYDLFYQALSRAYCGEEPMREESRFLDHAFWQRSYVESETYRRELSEWLDKLKAPLPILDLPCDFQRPAHMNTESGTIEFELPTEIAEKLTKFCSKEGISEFNVLFSAYSKLLTDYSGQEEAVIGVPMRGRVSSSQLNTLGFFANPIAIRSRKHLYVKELLRDCANETAWASERERTPFEKIKEGLNLKRDASRTNVTQAFFSHQRLERLDNLFNGIVEEEIQLPKSASYTDLDVWVKSSDKSVWGAFEYRKDLFEEKTAQGMVDYFLDLVDFITTSIDGDFRNFRSKSALEKTLKINGKLSDQDCGESLIELFDKQAALRGEETCLLSATGRSTYKEVYAESVKVANGLSKMGIGAGDLVGVSLHRDLDLIPLLLGIMRVGAGYAPLSPYFPQDRLEYMIEQSEAKIVLTSPDLVARFAKYGDMVKSVEEISREDGREKKYSIPQNSTAYVIYTSGSTGKPKGVEIVHAGLSNFLKAMERRPGFTHKNKMLAVTTISFDISILEMFLPLITGGQVYIATKDESVDGQALKKAIEDFKIDTVQATPPTWRLLSAAGWKPPRGFKALCGGEAFPPDLAKSLVPACSEVWNMYGPTETTVWATLKKLEDPDEKPLIGRPVDNYSVYILDEFNNPAPIGAVGEIFIGGQGVGLGYRKRPDLTEERFIADDIRGEGRMYKTGDLGRFTASGELECFGRNDDQVKIRGFRIELGEIQVALSNLKGVEQAVVMAREDRPGDKRLVAYLIGEEKGPIEMRDSLKDSLPFYMIPANFIWMDEFPLSLTGKVDKKRLPALDFAEEIRNKEETKVETSQESDDLEKQFAAIWKELLAVDRWDPEDDFFDLGGNSILSVDLFAAIKKRLGVNLPLSNLVGRSTYSGLLKLVREAKGDTPRRTAGKAINKATIKTEGAPLSQNVPSFCSSLVAIKTDGSKNPLFCFHSVGGNILNYLPLAPHLEDRPLYGLQSRGLDGKSEALEDVVKMARHYVDELRLIQPKGPYVLAGGSMGGVIAFEAACILEQAGEKVEKVIMFDTFGPNLNFQGYRKKNRLAEKIDFLRWIIKSKIFKAQQKIMENFGIEPSHKIRLFNVEAANWKALWNYDHRIYNGDVTLIRAPLRNTSWYREPDMGWKAVVKGNLDVQYMEGDHESFMEQPELPKRVQNVLEAL